MYVHRKEVVLVLYTIYMYTMLVEIMLLVLVTIYEVIQVFAYITLLTVLLMKQLLTQSNALHKSYRKLVSRARDLLNICALFL